MLSQTRGVAHFGRMVYGREFLEGALEDHPGQVPPRVVAPGQRLHLGDHPGELLNVPEANWILGGGLVFLLVVLTIYTVRVMLSESRTAPGRA